MKTLIISLFLFTLIIIPGCKQSDNSADDIWNLAKTRKSDLRLSTYITAHTVEQMFTTESGRREVISLLRCNGITKVYFEVYRSGLVISPELIKSSVSFLKDNGAKIIMTSGFIANAGWGEELARLAQVKWPLSAIHSETETVISEGNHQKLKFPLNMDYQIIPAGAEIILETADKLNNPFLVRNKNQNVFVLNSHTFSQEDFDAVGEVLLCPRQLGLPELPKPWINTIRSAFHSAEEPVIDAPSRISMQQLADRSFVIHNYNQEKTTTTIWLAQEADYIDGFTGKPIPSAGKEIRLEMPPRSRIWLKINDK